MHRLFNKARSLNMFTFPKHSQPELAQFGLCYRSLDCQLRPELALVPLVSIIGLTESRGF